MPRKSTNLPRTKPGIQEHAEEKAENKIRTDASKKTQISKLCSSKHFSLSQSSLLQKRWAAVPSQGGFNPPPNGVGVLNEAIEFCQSFPILPKPTSQSQGSQRFLSSPSLTPGDPRIPPGRPQLCGVSRSWRLLGRQNRVPRGLQTLIKFSCDFNIDF